MKFYVDWNNKSCELTRCMLPARATATKSGKNSRCFKKLVASGKFLYITECRKSYLEKEDRKALAESVCKKLTLASISIEKNSISYRAKEKQDPIIAVHRGSRPPVYYDEVEITGACRMIYRPDKPLSCGAVLWIEVDPGVEVKPVRFTKV